MYFDCTRWSDQQQRILRRLNFRAMARQITQFETRSLQKEIGGRTSARRAAPLYTSTVRCAVTNPKSGGALGLRSAQRSSQ